MKKNKDIDVSQCSYCPGLEYLDFGPIEGVCYFNTVMIEGPKNCPLRTSPITIKLVEKNI